MPFRNPLTRFVFPLTIALSALTLSGCHLIRFHHAEAQTAVLPRPHALAIAPILPVDLKTVQPNELGEIPILEYHDIVTSSKATGYQYQAVSFHKDMNWLYTHNYRPISLTDLVHGRIDLPAGMSPCVLTFDDALPGQFHYTSAGKIDPNCALGILEAMHAKHPDWQLRGTFFVLTDAQAKLEYLVHDGFEIGNHTVHHLPGMRHFSVARVQAEFAGAVVGIHHYLPGYNVQTLALPYGIYPMNQKLVISGQSGGVSYHNICAMLAGANPAPSPISKRFNPYRLPRIIPGTETFALTYWLNYLQTHRADRFISDGDPNTYTVKVADKESLSMARLHAEHFHLRIYNGTKIIASS
jgi:hypothetical protein